MTAPYQVLIAENIHLHFGDQISSLNKTRILVCNGLYQNRTKYYDNINQYLTADDIDLIGFLLISVFDCVSCF